MKTNHPGVGVLSLEKDLRTQRLYVFLFVRPPLSEGTVDEGLEDEIYACPVQKDLLRKWWTQQWLFQEGLAEKLVSRDTPFTVLSRRQVDRKYVDDAIVVTG